MNIVWLWVIYIVVLLVAWLLICGIGKAKMGIGFVLSAIFALFVGFLLIPYFRDPNNPEENGNVFKAFATVIIVIPIIGILYCIFAYKDGDYDDHNNKVYTKIDATCNMDGECVPDKITQKFPEGKVKMRFM